MSERAALLQSLVPTSLLNAVCFLLYVDCYLLFNV
jgi:hypothetical protein